MAKASLSPEDAAKSIDWSVYTLDELRSLWIDAPEPVVDGLINEGETVLLVGRPKVGKSRLAQQLTLCLSRAEPFLNLLVPEPRVVLVLDLENRLFGVKSRFELMSNRHVGDRRIFVYAPDTLSESKINLSKTGMRRLETWVAKASVDVLIIDTWRLFVGGDENKQETIVQALKALSSLRKEHPKLTIILVHHLRKEKLETPVRLMEDPHTWVESVSGHHALVGHVDACYGLERHPYQGEELIVFGGVARNAAPCTILLQDDEDTLRFEVANGEQAVYKLMTPKERAFWEVAKQLRRFTWSEILKAAKTTNKKTLGSTLRKAERHGLLHRSGKQYTVTLQGTADSQDPQRTEQLTEKRNQRNLSLESGR